MSLGVNIKKIRKIRGLTQIKLAELTNLSRSYLADVERDRYNPSVETLTLLADALNVSTDYLLGLSITALIENQLGELGMTLEVLSQKTGIPLKNLENLDSTEPMMWDYEKGDLIDKLAEALRLDRKKLGAAFARQEPPVYDGPKVTVEEAFGDENFDAVNETVTKYTALPGVFAQEAGFLEWARENLGDVFFYDFDSAPEERKAQLMKDIIYLWERDKNKK